MMEIIVLCAALALDMALGDPKNRYHPTAWMGSLVAVLVPAAGRHYPRAGGIALVIVLVLAASVPLLLLEWALVAFPLLGIVSGVILLKCTMAVRGMERHALDVAQCVERGDLESARGSLSKITKRNTSGLGKQGILSGVLESVSENTTDGVTGPMFYYSLFGLAGAFAYRAVNTADSMIGYRNATFAKVGWFAARCDTALNYVPSRLTGLLMIASAALLKNDWRCSYYTMLRDGRLTQSRNSGYAMAALAGALHTRLEKPGCHSLGDGGAEITAGHVRDAVSMMKVTVVLFAGLVCAPAMAALYLAGWHLA